MNASSETTKTSSEKHPLRWSTFITPRGGDNRPPFQNYGSLQNSRISRKIDPRLYNPLSRLTKRETGELHGKSKPRRKPHSDRDKNWQELQKRKFISGKPLEPPVDATSFMRKRPDKNKRLVRYVGHQPGKHISKPRQVIPSNPESASTSGHTTRSSVTLPDGLDANEDDVEAPPYLNLPRGSSEPHDERRQVLDKSNIKINNIREIFKDDMSDNKQLTINLVVRPGSNKTTNHPPEAIVLPPIPATAANNYTPFNSTSQAPSQPYPRNTNEVSVTQQVPITEPPLLEGGNDPRNGRSFKGMGDPGNKYQPRSHSPYINGVPKYQDQSMNWHNGQIPANGHGLPNERRVLTPSHRNYDPDLETSRRQIPESYRTTGGPFRQPTYFRAESPRTRSELPYFDERRNMLSPSFSEPHPGRGFDPRRAPTPDDLRKLSAKRFLKANDRQRRDHPSREKSVWEAQQGETRYVAMTPPPHRHKQPNLPYQRLHDKENNKPQKTVSTLTGEVQYLVKNPHKSYKSRPSSRTHSLSSKGSVTMVTDQPKVTRVKDSVAQTDLDYDEDIDGDDQIKSNITPSSRPQEIAIQTNPRDAPPQSKEVGSQWVYDDFERSKEISVQVDNDDLIFNKEISTQVENDDIVQNKEISTQTRDDDLPRLPVTMATQTYMDFEDAHTPPPQLRHKMYKSNDMYSKINEIIKEEGEASTADNDSRKDSGFRGSSTQKEADNVNHDDDDDEAVFSFDTISGFSQYYMYMRTDDGGVIGPLKFECKETHLGLPVRSQSDATHDGLRNRATGSNSVNEHSSRSHSMLTLNIESDMVDPDDDNLYVTKHGKLTFVDLAGSEKTKTGSEMAADPGHLAETNNINRSLLVLGNCISALGDPKKRQGHIPYRDSKLTKLLADSLGGQGVTLMIACVAPSAVNSAESMNTLRYANRAKKIKSKPVVKMDPREKLIISLKREIKVLRQENHYLRQQLDFPVKPRGQLQKENDAKFLQMLKEQKRDGKVSDHGLYEMLQEYMIENETLRHENSDLLQSKDGGRREQQLLARENERLLKKMDHYEKERVMLQSPVSVYSTGSTLSRKSTGLYSQYEGQPYTNGHQDNRKDAPWGPQRQPHIAESPRGKKTSPPSHLQHPMKPPHRLNEPVNNPAYIDNNSYSSQYQQHKHSPDAAPRGQPRGRERNIPQHSENDDYAAYHQQHSQPRGSDHSPSRIPRPRKEDPSPQRSRTNDYSPNRQPSNRSKDKPGAVPNVAFGRPAGKNTGKSPPVQRKFNKGGPSQQPALLTINSDEENLQVTETDKALQDRLRQDLVDLQGQIRNQAQQLERTQGDQGNTKQGRR